MKKLKRNETQSEKTRGNKVYSFRATYDEGELWRRACRIDHRTKNAWMVYILNNAAKKQIQDYEDEKARQKFRVAAPAISRG